MKQHLIDPELCIRCHTCEDACPIGAITHDENTVVVDASKCKFCMDCILPCPTGSIDNWRVVDTPYSLDEQLDWFEIPAQELVSEQGNVENNEHGIDDLVEELINGAHGTFSNIVKAPESASKPSVNLYPANKSLKAIVQGNYRLTAQNSDSDVRHIVLHLGNNYFPVLEGQTVGIVSPGENKQGKPHAPRLYSISSPRDGERPSTNNLSLTVKRKDDGLCSDYICELEKGDEVSLLGPFGSTFLIPNDPLAKLIMICTGTGSAPFRAFTMRKQREYPNLENKMTLFFGARDHKSLPYFGPLTKMPKKLLKTYFAFSRAENMPKKYVQDSMREHSEYIIEALKSKHGYIYLCGLKAMEAGVEQVFKDITRDNNIEWEVLKKQMCSEGRYHIETY